MTLRELVEGIEILRKHYNDPDGYHVGAEHDQIFLWATDTPLSEEEVAQMRELDWFQSETNEEEGYSPDDGWSAWA